MADTDSRAGKAYATPEILDWVARVHAPHDAALTRAFDAPAAHGMPAIQLGASEAKTVALLLKLAGARKVVEIGTLAGYSALVDGARAAAGRTPLDGRVRPEARARRARERRGGGGARARHRPRGRGPRRPPDARERTARSTPSSWTPTSATTTRYGRWAARNVRKGGLLVGDNAFLFGRLLEDSEEAAAMRRFHEEAREAFETVCLPTPDGMLIGVRR